MAQKLFVLKYVMKNWSDWMGVVASIACAIHCAAMPFVAMFLPMLGLSFLLDDSFHQVMVIVCSALAIAAFIPGFRRHGHVLPICVGIIGLSLISTAAFAMEDACCEACAAAALASADEVTEDACKICTEECCQPPEDEGKDEENSETTTVATASFFDGMTPWVTSLGGLLLVAAHLTNHRFSCRCGCCPPESDEGIVEPVA